MQTHTAQTNKNKHFTLPSFLIPLDNNKDVDNSKTRGEKLKLLISHYKVTINM